MTVEGAFDDSMYDRIRDGCQRSAEVIVPLVNPGGVVTSPDGQTWTTNRRVVDVGCGEGWFARKFAELGSDVVGIDVRRPDDWESGDFFEWDLTKLLPEVGTFDLAVCLEVAEHLPVERGPSFVDDLCDLAPAVLWSAAIPGQGGHLHINEQWPSYWARYFAERDYQPFVDLRESIWNDTRVEPWYRQNLILFAQSTTRLDVAMLDVVHPEIFGWRVNEAR